MTMEQTKLEYKRRMDRHTGDAGIIILLNVLKKINKRNSFRREVGTTKRR